MQIRAFRGRRTVMSLRLCSRAPRTTISSAAIAASLARGSDEHLFVRNRLRAALSCDATSPARVKLRRGPGADRPARRPAGRRSTGHRALQGGACRRGRGGAGPRRAAVRLPGLRRSPHLRLARKRETGDHRLSGHGRHVRTRGGRGLPAPAARRSGVPGRPSARGRISAPTPPARRRASTSAPSIRVSSTLGSRPAR